MNGAETWRVPATVVEVRDGDTITADIDLGWKLQLRREGVRLYRVKAKKATTEEGARAKLRLAELCPVGSRVWLISRKLLGEREKYGRTLASVFVETGPLAFRDVGQQLITEGLADVYTGEGPGD